MRHAQYTMIRGKSLLMLLSLLLFAAWHTPATAAFDPAVTCLAPNWESTTIYQGDLGVYPSSMTEDPDGNILLYDRGTKRLIAVSPTNTISTLADLSSLGGVRAIAYQSARNRLLIVSDGGALYAFDASGIQLLKASGVSGESIAVDPTDGSFYLGTMSIIHYGPEGDRLGVLVGWAYGISQMALDARTGTIYYSEPYRGTISAIDVSGDNQQTLISGVGIPGSFEPISVALDSQGVLYYFPGAAGLYRYDHGRSTKVLDSIGGAGDLLWSARRNAFIQTQGAGANLIKYDLRYGGANLTRYLNAFAIAELADGTLIIPDSESPDLLRVDSDGLSLFVRNDGAYCNAFTRDDEGEVYAGCGSTVYRVRTDARLVSVATFSESNVASLAYDPRNNSLIVSTNTDDDHQMGDATIWRLPLNGSRRATAVISFHDIIVNNVLPGVAADRDGNIYILERSENKIFKVANAETSRTVFASDVLASAAITVPHILYLQSEDGLLVSTITDYELWPLANPGRQTFAVNAGAVDNFATFETVDGDIVAAHSGQFFRMSMSGSTASDMPPSPPVLEIQSSGLQVTAEWSAVSSATGYTLFYAPYPDPTYIGNIPMGSATSVTVDLCQGAAFYVAVTADNAAGSSGYSNIEYFVLP